MKRKVAIASDDTLGLRGRVSLHFGHCRSWVLVELEGDEILTSQILANPFDHHDGCQEVGDFLASQGIEVVLAGGLGRNAHGYLAERGITAISGFSGGVEECLRAWQQGGLPGPSLCDHRRSRHAH